MKIRADIRERLVAHARREAPLEACGYLAVKDGVLAGIHALTNCDKSPEHFSFDPKEQFAAVREARSNGTALDAVYHSHPASPARPSAEDIRLAYDADKLYVIVSLAGGCDDVRAFWIREGQVTEEILEVVHDNRI